ncbi:GGDEF domain-containing protein [Soehngenia saccharolytica]|nr:GGDEF domain-containing protein [Soehngenia saccharolytica]
MKQKQERLKERTEAFTQKILLQQKETERRAAEHQSKIDALTGLGNRFLLEENLAAHLEYAIARQEKICLAVIDIDHFKTHNDLYGHMHGDHCLRLTASVLKSCVGKAGSVYRFGGDEFLVLLNITDYDSVRDIAENIKQHFNLDESEDITDSGLTVTLSQGYAICRTDADSRKDILISKADKALYAVKNSGKNNYLIFEED